MFLATTCYAGLDPGYTFAIQNSRAALSAAGIESVYLLHNGNCHVDDARNDCVREFLASDCGSLVFLDADVSWEPSDLVRLCQHDVDMVGGVYPYRREGKENDLPMRMLPGVLPAPGQNGLVEVAGLPAGFMRISRGAITRLCDAAESFSMESVKTYIVFRRSLDADGIRWGGDLHVCNEWRKLGGKVYCDWETVLGHAGRVVMRDSPAATFRRRVGTTLAHVARRVREGTAGVSDMTEAIKYVANPWGADEATLLSAIALARRAEGPIIEAGTGLSTVLMAAAAPDQIVYCLEHRQAYADKLIQMAASAGVKNIGLCLCPMSDNWYDLSDMDIPKRFAVGLNDGPPRAFGSRSEFFRRIACDVVVCDDAEDPEYRAFLERCGRVDYIGTRTAIVNFKDAA